MRGMGLTMTAAAALLAMSLPARPDEAIETGPSRCTPLKAFQAALKKEGVTWTDLTPAQRWFIAGVYTTRQDVVPGLPYGDRAALTSYHNGQLAILVLVDGDRACVGFPIGAGGLALLADVKANKITHETRPGS
jgi:hypothetical protein